MRYYSLNKQSPNVNFREAAVSGQAPDRGLYFPEKINVLPASFFKDFKTKSRAEIAYQLIVPYAGDEIPSADLMRICEETVNFDFPLKQITPSIYALELYHGPTLAFKDVGARFMSRCLGYFSKNKKNKITVLVATSGDTGSAVANGFWGVEGVDVIILYPSGKVSAVQEKQLTTLGKNITALEVQGTFDDCQRMVKQAFADNELKNNLSLTSANSINVARWLPQQFYYLFALQQWAFEEEPVMCVPSGNFGNLCAGLLTYVSGAPIKHFIAACNSNDVFSAYLKTGQYTPKQAVATVSNAMDVGDPSNFVRMLELFENDHERLKSLIEGAVITNSETEATISKVYKKYNYLLDPHGAVAFKALEDFLQKHPNQKGIILETAHPVKFDSVIKKCIGDSVVQIPENLNELLTQQKKSVVIKANYIEFKQYLMS